MSHILILVIILTASANLGEALSLNTTGFEGCLFHVVDADGGSSIATRDLIESIVTLSGGRQLWTLSTNNDSKKVGPIAFSFELEERCSVNIFVRLEPGLFSSIETVFGSRGINTQSIIIFVVSSHHREVMMRIGEEAKAFLITHLFLNILGSGMTLGIEESFVFCGRCTQAHSLVALAHPTDLLDMLEFSQEVRRSFHHRTLLATIFPSGSFKCQIWYPAAFRFSAGQHIVCDPRQVFIQHLAHRLNSTHEFDLRLSSGGIYHNGEKAPTGVVSMDTLAWSTNHPSMIHYYLRDTTKAGFFYCRRSVERESFSFFFWAVPFDAWGWALLALSLIVLTLVSKGDWLDVFGALVVRQSYSTLDKNKTLILLLFAAIVITCVYESIVSSHLIVPPPIIVAQRLKDLVEAGYGILGYDNRGDNTVIFLLLRRENISHSSLNEPPFVPNPKYGP
jgi:hypothetical protein